MADNYRELMVEISPAWMVTRRGKPFVEAFGEVKDSLMYRMLEAARIRFPKYATADALAAIGAERKIPRAVGESIESYAARLRGAWDAWSYAGTAVGLLRALYDSGYTNAAVAQFNRRLYTLDADRNLVSRVLDPGSWLFRSTADTYWSRFVVLFPLPLIQRWVDDGVPADVSDEADAIRNLIRRWKPAHMVLEEIRIGTSAETWGYFPEGGTWGDAGTWGQHSEWTRWAP